MPFPVSRWSKKTSFINKVPGDCGACSGEGDSSDVLARINLPDISVLEGGGLKGKGVSSRANSGGDRPDTGLSMHTQASMDSVGSHMSVSSRFRMDGLSRSVTMGIKTANNQTTGLNDVAGPRKNSCSVPDRRASWSMGMDPYRDRFTRPEMAWRREPDNQSNIESIGSLGCSIL